MKEGDSNGPEGVHEVEVFKDTDTARVGKRAYVITHGKGTLLLQFPTCEEVLRFHGIVDKFKSGHISSIFAQRTDEASATQYFQFYGYLSQQQNMMQDYIRTSTYQRAILNNMEDFKDKVILDVGAGSGILSFFAVQAGARKVFAVEASSMAKHAECLVYHNKASDKVVVVPGKIEEITLPEPVDVIISEPMGYMLFNERMLETYLHAKKWLKPRVLPGNATHRARCFPTRGDLHIAPFSDTCLYMEQLNKANFCPSAVRNYLARWTHAGSTIRRLKRPNFSDQAVVLPDRTSDRMDFSRMCLVLNSFNWSIGIHLYLLNRNLEHMYFLIMKTGGSRRCGCRQSPTQPLTHWYQVRCLLESPLFVQRGQTLGGRVVLRSNRRQSYDVDLELELEGGARACNSLDLKNPFFRYTGQPPQPPPGYNEASPSEAYWAALDANAVGADNGAGGQLMMNGVPLMNGSGVVEMHQVAPQAQHQPLGVHLSNVVSLGSLPSPGTLNSTKTVNSRAQSVPTSSIGGGISPALFNQQQVLLSNASQFPVNSSLMIGDYVTPGNILMPTAGLGSAYKN
ncbi:hypothetical protein HPB47_022378 [Ixodes persulcatus]|uniref:Uncharacterized protein n=1 Tax=Ixodes persulcatus TaxID=34615 RepID=A0AC60Q9U4_IXOPE|nr:hypothetical protein HPB47_022378 [Ixodes persulcatus]